MTANKKKKPKQLSLFGVKDERIPKLIGMVLIFFGLYLFIAFTSHLFTWRGDQNVFYPFTWEKLLASDLEVQNWLGRLGAAVSNMFFYWLFGLPSFIVVFLLFVLGLGLINQTPLRKYWPVVRTSVVLLILIPVFLEFVFGEAEFPWGGAIGESISSWMYSFVGTAGMIALFVFVLIGVIIWNLNPGKEDLTPSAVQDGLNKFFNDLISGSFWSKKERREPITQSSLRPGSIEKQMAEAGEGAAKAEDTNETVAKGEQLSFDLSKKKKGTKAQSLKSGDAELEIETAQQTLDQGQIPSILQSDSDGAGMEPYDPTLEIPNYKFPSLDLLDNYSDQKFEIDRAELESNKDQIIETLLNYKIEIIKIKATIGPTVTLYEIVPAAGVRISRIKNLEDDIALSLSALGIRIIAPIPGKGTIGIEVPNKKKQIVSLKEVLASSKFNDAKMQLPIALGKTISNEVFVADLAKMPHLLIAGATGQGKSVGINVVLMSLLYKKHPSQVKFVLVDPKKVELFPYSKLENHFLAYLPDLDEPIVTDTTKVVHTLNSLLIEMEQRYNLMKKAESRNIKEYNQKFVARRLNPEKGHRFLPNIILVIDEFADLIMTAGKEIELPIGRLAQLSRAVGIHLIIATQRPSVNIITGVIKANFPARIAFKVTAKVDSRTIIDTGGADRLIGRGDMLLSYGADLIRLQCAFVDTPEIERVIESISKQPAFPTPFFLPEFLGEDAEHQQAGFSIQDLDEMFDDAARLVVQNQHGSTSMIQRRLKLGYNRAGRIMDQMEALGIVGPADGSKPREVLIYNDIELERFLEDLKNQKDQKNLNKL